VADLPLADRPEVILPDDDAALTTALQEALFAEDERAALAAVVAGAPAFVSGWSYLAEAGRDDVETYAYARVGYHRGLDALRRAGWGGNGFVRWKHPSNRGFLRCLARLRDAADAIGEQGEVERIEVFLHELDPDWTDRNVERR
jgi:hypothetical protein